MKTSHPWALCAIALSLLSTGAAAQGVPERNFYVGTSIGAMLIRPEGVSETDSNRTASGRASPGVFVGARVGALPIGEGWPVFVELGYQDIARHTVPYKTRNGTSELTASGHSAYAAGKVHFWTPGNFALYGKLGIAQSSVKGSTPAGQPAIPISGNGTSLLWGVGGQYDLDGGLSLRIELTSLGETSAKSSAGGLSLGLAYRF